MGEDRWEYAVVNKITRAALMPCSPEALVVLMLPIPPSPLSPCCLLDELAQMPIAEQCNEDIVISKKEKASISEHMPEARTASTSLVHVHVLPMQISAPCQSTDECPPEATPRRPGTHIINARCSISTDARSLTAETAQKQSEFFKATSMENQGLYLE